MYVCYAVVIVVMVDRRGLQSPVRGSSRGNTPDPAVHPKLSPPPSPPPDKDDESSEDSEVRNVFLYSNVL